MSWCDVCAFFVSLWWNSCIHERLCWYFGVDDGSGGCMECIMKWMSISHSFSMSVFSVCMYMWYRYIKDCRISKAWLGLHQKQHKVKTGGSAFVGWGFFSCLVCRNWHEFFPPLLLSSQLMPWIVSRFLRVVV